VSNVTSKGPLNRDDAYKASVAANIEAGRDPDHGINMGLHGSPGLMAADILALDADEVPVGAVSIAPRQHDHHRGVVPATSRLRELRRRSSERKARTRATPCRYSVGSRVPGRISWITTDLASA
jgi:hypothetical protein